MTRRSRRASSNQFNTNYNSTSTTFWNTAPSNPTSVTMNGQSNAYTRPGTAYLALRAILGKNNYNDALRHIQVAYRGGSITEAELKTEFHKYLPNQSPACHNKLDAFFTQWWDTPYTGSPGGRQQAADHRPGPGRRRLLRRQRRLRALRRRRARRRGRATVPATLSLTLGAPATFGAFTPGVAKDYTASTTATVISTAGDAALTYSDPGTSPTARSRCRSRCRSSLSKSTWSAPVSNDVVTIGFTQPIAANDALRTGTYSKTLTFTLSTTTP